MAGNNREKAQKGIFHQPTFMKKLTQSQLSFPDNWGIEMRAKSSWFPACCYRLSSCITAWTISKTRVQADKRLRSGMKGRMSLKNKCLLMLISGIRQIMEIFFLALQCQLSLKQKSARLLRCVHCAHAACLFGRFLLFGRLAAEWAALVERLSKACGNLRSLTFFKDGLLCGQQHRGTERIEVTETMILNCHF